MVPFRFGCRYIDLPLIAPLVISSRNRSRLNFWLASPSSHLRPLAGAVRVVPHTRCAVVRERGLSSGRAGLATGGYLGLEFCRLLALGLGWLEATFRGALRPSLHTVLED